MPAYPTSVGQELLNVPMGKMIRDMALAIAEAQFELDKSSIMVAEMMGGQRMLRDNDGNLVDWDGTKLAAKRDSGGNPVYDEDGDLVYEDANGPRVVDSRVHFGYLYEEIPGATESDPVTLKRKPKLVSMMELGFTPTFYQFVDTIIEVKIAVKVTREVSYGYRYSNTTTTTTKKDIVEAQKTSSWSWSWGSSNLSGASYKHKKVGETTRTVTSSVDASYQNKYGYSAEGSSLLRTKLVPVPVPAILEERIHEVMDAERAYLKRLHSGDAVGEDKTPDPAPTTP